MTKGYIFSVVYTKSSQNTRVTGQSIIADRHPSFILDFLALFTVFMARLAKLKVGVFLVDFARSAPTAWHYQPFGL